MKKLLSTIAALALAFTALVAFEAPASATESVGVYPLNVNTASSPGNAKDFITYNGKVYFTADSLDHGRAIYSTDATNPSGYTYVGSRGEGTNMGDPKKLFGFNNQIMYWDSPANNYNTYVMFGHATNLTSYFRWETPAGNDLVTEGSHIYNFVTVNGKMYFVAAESDAPTNYKLWSNDSNGNLTMEYDIDFTPAVSGLDSNQGYNGPKDALFVQGDNILMASENSGWNTNDSQIKSFNTTSNTLTTIDNNGSAFPGAQIAGTFRYNNESVMILAKRNGWDWRYFYLKADGTMNQLGNFTAGGWFVNLGERLFFYTYPTFSEVSTTDGSLTNMISTFAPTAQSINVESIIQSNGKLLMMAKIIDNTAIPANVEHLYKWDGTGALVQLGTASPIAGGEWLPEWPTTNGWSRNTEMGVAGTGMIVNLYLDAAVGYEPYYVSATGATTALGNIDTATEGSNPRMNCSASTVSADYISAEVTGTFGSKNVLTELKQDGIYLKYKVLEIANVSNICGMASDGTNLFFAGYDGNHDSVFKMDANHVVTRIGDMSSYTYQAASYNGSYFWLDGDNNDVFMTSSAGVETKLTGTGSDLIRNGSVREIKQLGSKLYISGQTEAGNNYNLFSIDMANPTAAPVSYLPNANSEWKNQPRALTVVGTKLYFGAGNPVTNTGSKLFSVDSTNNSPAVEVLDVLADNSITDIVDQILVVGADLYIEVVDDNSNDTWLVKQTGNAATASVVTFADSFKPTCMANIAGDLMISNRDGVAKYLGDGSTTYRDAGINFTANHWALCDSLKSPRGSYVVNGETKYTNGPFGSEPTYIGSLIPIAVERLGVAVTEAPATAIPGSTQTGFPGNGGTSVDTDDVNLGTLDETLDFNGSFGSIDFPDGSGFIIDAKGNVKAKTKSIYLVQAAGKIKFSYPVGSKTKSVTCTIKTFGSKKKVKTAFTAKKLYVSAKICKLPAAVIKAMKTGPVSIVQTLAVKRYYSTTMKAKTPGGAVIKAQKRKMTVRMGKLN